jgi:hypothetical protein
LAVLIYPSYSRAGLLEDIFKKFGGSFKEETSENTIIAGLKEALTIGTQKAVTHISKKDGYFSNESIKILMPEKIKTAADILKKIGFQSQVDHFLLSMNRAAEKAAPEAASFFMDALQEMSFEDARKILNGADTAATDYFKATTSDKIYNAFKPIISSSMDTVGVTQAYKEMMNQYESIPFTKKETLDLDHYVTTKALAGLFFMVGREEKKIRNDPAARVTELLKKVFDR